MPVAMPLICLCLLTACYFPVRRAMASSQRLWPGCPVGLTLVNGRVVGVVVSCDNKLTCVAVPASIGQGAGGTVIRSITCSGSADVEVAFLKVSRANCSTDLSAFADAPRLANVDLAHLL